MTESVKIVGAGLAGSEAAWQLAQAGVQVQLSEIKPIKRTPAQNSDELCELVCSNSLRSNNHMNAIGLLKEEMRRLDSLIIRAAYENRVPAGDALAVERIGFSQTITQALDNHPNITRTSEVVESLPEEGHTIISTGPLTDAALATSIQEATGQDRLYFYDAIAPIVSGDSLNRDIIFAASRYGKGGGDDYLNCPLNKEQYEAFIDAILEGECMPLHNFEEPKYFQGCLPIEVVAAGGRETLRYGAMKPVGLDDPRTGRWPYAVLQLRKEDPDGQAYNMVGFQTKLKYPEQKRIFKMIPGMEDVEFVRLGAIHRNTYLDSPELLDARMRLKTRPNIRFAGQITGVEGYVESAAHGLMTGRLLAADVLGQTLNPPPRETALGCLWQHVQGINRLDHSSHEPQNINWAMFTPPPEGTKKHEKKRIRVLRAEKELNLWAEENGIELATSNIVPEELVKKKKPKRAMPLPPVPEAN